jgi:hypothetical protein
MRSFNCLNLLRNKAPFIEKMRSFSRHLIKVVLRQLFLRICSAHNGHKISMVYYSDSGTLVFGSF